MFVDTWRNYLETAAPKLRNIRHDMTTFFRVVILLAMVVLAAPAPGQKSAAPKGKTVVTSQTASFGPMFPGRVGMPAAVAVPFRLSIPASTVRNGYRISAISSFVFTPTAFASGGKSITEDDIGVGIVGLSSLLGPNATGNAAVMPGFDYDPATVRAGNGMRPYPGAASGRANLSDLAAGREIVQVGKFSSGRVPAGNDQLTLTVRIALPTQFFTPGGFSGTISVIVAE